MATSVSMTQYVEYLLLLRNILVAIETLYTPAPSAPVEHFNSIDHLRTEIKKRVLNINERRTGPISTLISHICQIDKCGLTNYWYSTPIGGSFSLTGLKYSAS